MAQEIVLSAAQVIDLVKRQEDKFRQLDLSNGRILDFERECLFARQQLLKNEFTLKTAAARPHTLEAAILNVAAIGISLNPAMAHAYLVPRDGSICLDISYQGLKKLATDSGAIKWAKVELVYAADSFEWNGPSTVPTHKANPFATDRGAMVGGYCIAKLPDGETLIETMSAAEIDKVRLASKAQNGPWKTWPEEMAKKVIMKRAYKSWPQTPNRVRLDYAVAAMHEAEGSAYTIEQQTEFMRLIQSEDDVGLFLFINAIESEHGDDAAILPALFNSFDKGQKTSGKEKMRSLHKSGQEKLLQWAADLVACVDAQDSVGAEEILGDISQQAAEFLCLHLNTEQAHKLEQLRAY